jgi:hypothetical protein
LLSPLSLVCAQARTRDCMAWVKGRLQLSTSIDIARDGSGGSAPVARRPSPSARVKSKRSGRRAVSREKFHQTTARAGPRMAPGRATCASPT